jgi:DNA-binding NarL/FixJ family response regulator
MHPTSLAGLSGVNRAGMLTCVGLRLLIVDDNASFLEAARGLLEREGFTVVGTASDSATALALAQARQPEVVLVDVDLAEESGMTLAHALVDADAALQVIMISAYPEEDLPGIAEQAPARGFIGKSDLSRTQIERLLSAPRDT